jgi:hypothetical protein
MKKPLLRNLPPMRRAGPFSQRDRGTLNENRTPSTVRDSVLRAKPGYTSPTVANADVAPTATTNTAARSAVTPR